MNWGRFANECNNVIVCVFVNDQACRHVSVKPITVILIRETNLCWLSARLKAGWWDTNVYDIALNSTSLR